MKQHLALSFADLVYNGQWYTPLRESLSAFFDKALETTTGTVRLKLYKGRCYSAGVKSPYSLHDADIATFSEDEVYNQKDAEGFINLFGLPLKVRALKLKKIPTAKAKRHR
jgi:argininosuccinate synthase